MDRILVSVCMITYGHEKFIEQAITSIINQNVAFDLELVIANDCSPDQTDKIVKELEKKYIDKPNFKIRYFYHNKNLGVGSNLVFTLKKCYGKYIAICEGDDFWTDPLKLQEQVNFLENNTEYIVAYHGAICVNEKGEVVSKSKLKDRGKKDLSALQLMQGEVPKFLTVCFRNIIEDYPQEQMFVNNGDVFLMSMLGNHGRGKHLNNIKPSCYRVHEGGVWSLASKEKKQISKVNTYQQLYNFYKRVGNMTMKKYFKKRVRNHKKILISHYLKKNNYFAAGNYLIQFLKG